MLFEDAKMWLLAHHPISYDKERTHRKRQMINEAREETES